jgi:hypothetical protein
MSRPSARAGANRQVHGRLWGSRQPSPGAAVSRGSGRADSELMLAAQSDQRVGTTASVRESLWTICRLCVRGAARVLAVPDASPCRPAMRVPCAASGPGQGEAALDKPNGSVKLSRACRRSLRVVLRALIAPSPTAFVCVRPEQPLSVLRHHVASTESSD